MSITDLLTLININKINSLYSALISLEFQWTFDFLPWKTKLTSLENGCSRSLQSVYFSMTWDCLLISYILICFMGSREAIPNAAAWDYVSGKFSLMTYEYLPFSMWSLSTLGYEDDLVILESFDSRRQLKHAGNSALHKIVDWKISLFLRLSTFYLKYSLKKRLAECR